MRAALIEDGVVVNVVEALPEEIDGVVIVDLAGYPDVHIGWAFAGGEFTAPPAQPEPVPAEVTMRQARLVLHAAGLLAKVDAAIDSLPEPERTRARIEWDYSNAVQRDHGFTATLGQALGLSSDAMDELFRAAARL